MTKDFSKNFKDELFEVFEKNLINEDLAVRSSATLEDGKEFSFAGIHSSYLYINGFDNIIENIKKCYASLWTLQAFSYRKNMKISHLDLKCAVVLCKMINNIKYSGVVFTSDPVTGRRDLIKISSTNGIAEKLVSGNINPDEITIKTNYINNEISRVSEKNKTLNDKEINLLCNISLKIIWDLGEGQQEQDIEWAYDGEKFWIVQSRPITNLNYPTLENLKNNPIIWSNANFKDAIPGIQSNLSHSSLVKLIRYIMYAPLEKSGIELPQGMEILRRFQGRMYFDLSFMQYCYNTFFNLTPTETNKLVGGHQPEIQVPKLSFLEKIRANLNSQKLLKTGTKNEKTIYSEMSNIKEKIMFYKSLDLTNKTEKDLFKYLFEIDNLLNNFAPKFQIANSSSGTSLTMLQMLMLKFAPDDAMEITTGLVAGSGNVTSAEQGYRIYELAKYVQKDTETLKYFNDKNFNVDNWVNINKNSIFMVELNKFLDEFGHRAVYEGDIANPRWQEDPRFIINQVKLILDSGEIKDPREIAKNTRKRVEDKLSKYSKLLGIISKKLAESARKGASLREQSKSILILTQQVNRILSLKIGELMFNKGIIEQKEDIFNLSKIDVNMYASGEWNGKGAKNLIFDIKDRNKKYLTHTPEDVIITDNKYNKISIEKLKEFKIDNEFSKINKSNKLGNIITGVGVSSGIVTGKARIINHPSESQKLQNGEILVAPSTDPGWTPLFLKASGIVMEIGGYLSHGAIVSREYGIPAVVNIPNILSILKDGQVITINGNKGEIIINKISS
jgi:phosphohistidine swiveling domain-containing protein